MIISFKKSKIKRDEETVAKHEQFDKKLEELATGLDLKVFFFAIFKICL